MSFVKFEQDESVVSLETIIQPAWGDTLDEISSFYTSSMQDKNYYLNIYNENINNNTSASIDFSIQYGNLVGSGSTDINSGVVGYSPTRISYGQYRTLIYGDEESNFNFGINTDSEDIIVLSIARNKFKESIHPTSFNLKLTNESGSLELTDDSKTTVTTSFIGSNKYHTIVSGSNGVTSDAAVTNPGGNYGFLFPDLGLVVLNPNALTPSVANGGLTVITKINTDITNSDPNPNLTQVRNLISSGGSFKLKSQETISSRIFFTRPKNSHFNYTTNPSIIDSNGNILFSSLIDNPQTFITTVGLYNDDNELLAVAKLSKPLSKSFVTETLFKVKLNY